jgi:hypothetical protein
MIISVKTLLTWLLLILTIILFPSCPIGPNLSSSSIQLLGIDNSANFWFLVKYNSPEYNINTIDLEITYTYLGTNYTKNISYQATHTWGNAFFGSQSLVGNHSITDDLTFYDENNRVDINKIEGITNFSVKLLRLLGDQKINKYNTKIEQPLNAFIPYPYNISDKNNRELLIPEVKTIYENAITFQIGDQSINYYDKIQYIKANIEFTFSDDSKIVENISFLTHWNSEQFFLPFYEKAVKNIVISSYDVFTE